MAFASNISTTSVLDVSAVEAFSDLVYFSAIQRDVAGQFAQDVGDFTGKSIQVPKYTALAVATTPLTEDTDPAAVALADDEVIFTPVEYGNSTITTRLGNFQSGGRIPRAQAISIGNNIGATLNKLATNALEGGTPVATVYPNSVTAASGLSNLDVMDDAFLVKMHNKLYRANVPPIAGDMYGIMYHGDVSSDLALSVGDLAKYGIPEAIRNSIVGVSRGFIHYTNNACTITSNAAGTIDSYKVVGFGESVLVKAVKENPTLIITDQLDKMRRFAFVSWYANMIFGILDGNNMVHGVCASSFGANAS